MTTAIRCFVFVGWLAAMPSAVLRAQQPSLAAAAQKVALQRSAVFILVGKTGLGHEHGVMGQLQSGQIALGQSRDAGQIVFDMRTFDADSPQARQYVGLSGETDERTRKQVNANMLGKDVLNVAQYPTATFQIQSALPVAAAAGANAARFELTGLFTLHGVQRPLKLVCDATPEGDGLRLRTVFTVLQSDFGMKPYTAALGAVGVANELKIFGDLLLTNGMR